MGTTWPTVKFFQGLWLFLYQCLTQRYWCHCWQKFFHRRSRSCRTWRAPLFVQSFWVRVGLLQALQYLFALTGLLISYVIFSFCSSLFSFWLLSISYWGSCMIKYFCQHSECTRWSALILSVKSLRNSFSWKLPEFCRSSLWEIQLPRYLLYWCRCTQGISAGWWACSRLRWLGKIVRTNKWDCSYSRPAEIHPFRWRGWRWWACLYT